MNPDYINIGISAFSAGLCMIKLSGSAREEKYHYRDVKIYYRMVRDNLIMLLAVLMANLAPHIIKDDAMIIMVRKVSYAACFVAYYMLLAAFAFYAYEFISRDVQKQLKPFISVKLIACIYGLLWLITPFNGIIIKITKDGTERGPLYLLGQLGGYMIVLQPFISIIIYRKLVSKNVILALSSYIIFPILVTVFRTFLPDIEFVPYTIMLSLEFVGNVLMYESEKQILEDKEKLSKMRIQLLLSQIKPHFVYNVLNSIHILCEKDPLMAQEAIGEFSDYLRVNLNYVEKEESISFMKEMDIVRNYLNLEKMRFGDKLNVIYDLKIMGFKVPAISVQILAENAVKHGLLKKEEGGTLKISSYLEGEQVVIEVFDDGAGYEENAIRDCDDSESSHKGLAILRERLKIMVNGTLEIVGKKNFGTCAKIRIPINKKEGFNEKT